METYSAIKCPNCGSGSIVPAEGGRIFCRSCDQFFEKVGRPAPAISPVAPTEPVEPVEDLNDVDTFGEKYVWAMLIAIMLFFVWLVVVGMMGTQS